MAKIIIDAGHGLYTSGKRCLNSIDPSETREWSLNSRVAGYVVDLLTDAGHEVMRTDDTSGVTDVPLPDRCRKANNFGASLFISIHHNAGIDGGSGGGAVVYVYNGKHSTMADGLQSLIYVGILKHVGKYGNRATPLASANLYVLRHTAMPSVLVECGFMDSTNDTPMILTDDFARKCASGIAEGICKLMGGNVSEHPGGGSLPAGGQDNAAPEDDSDITTSYTKKFQAWLNSYGMGINADGILGPKTKRAAVRVFQTELNKQFGAGLSVDGIIGSKTTAAMISVKRGAAGNLTRLIQGMLYAKGYNPAGFDGIFGAGCESAVKQYQGNTGISADGIVGKNTWTYLLG